MTMVLELTEAQQETLRRYAVTQGLTEEKVLAQLVETLPVLPAPEETPAPRIAGLFAGQLWMSDDFNDPLPDDFWFPQEKEKGLHDSPDN